jgi:endoglucanase
MIKLFRIVMLHLLLIAACWQLSAPSAHAQTPVQKNGQLKVIGTKLCNQYGNPIQLRGMSTHGIQWHGWGKSLNETSLNTLAYEWGADILRISLYVQEGGYETNPTGYTNQVKTLVNEATERGMYALVDWHQLTPGDPNFNLARAKTFFTEIANTFKGYNNIIYDVCNEPNGNNTTWPVIKTYADQIIPVIRAIDSDAVVLVGTHAWSSMGISMGRSAQDIVSNQLSFPNVMYTFHFYAKDHRDQYLNELSWAADRLPVFVSEFGSQEASGDGPNDFVMTQRYIDMMRQKKISWTNWNYSDDPLSGAVWKTGISPNGPWTTNNLKEAGLWIRDKIMSPADDFPGGGTNQLPTVSITAPTSGSSFTAPASITVSANAADADGSITGVSFYQGTTLLGTDNTAPYSYTWSNVSAGSYSFTAIATDNAGASTTSGIVNVSVTTSNSGANLALNKTATTSSIEGAGMEGSKAVDGNLSTRWASAETATEWITVDLGASYAVNRVKITWEAAYAANYVIEISSDNNNWTPLRTVTGNTALVNDYAGLSGSGRYVRVYNTVRGLPYGYSIYELEVYGSLVTNPVSNLALNKSVTTSSVEAAGLEGGKAVDGNATTRWASAETALAWIAVDLGGTYSISRVKITWEAAYGKDYVIETSNDGNTWSTLKPVAGNTTLVNDHTGLSGTARYVRINATVRGTEWGYSIYELEVYGTATAAARTTEANEIVAYPNPAEDEVTLLFDASWRGGKVLLLDYSGNVLKQENIDNIEHNFDLSGVPTGNYLLKATNGTKSTVRKIRKK